MYVVTPTDLDADDTRVYLELHGGAFIVGGRELCKGNGILEAAPHGFFRGATPEDHHLDRQVRRFIDEHCPAWLPTS